MNLAEDQDPAGARSIHSEFQAPENMPDMSDKFPLNVFLSHSSKDGRFRARGC